MLAHSPPLPLLIDYTFYAYRNEDITLKDKEGAIVALMQRGRVRRIRIWMPVTGLQKLTVAMDDEYPILGHLIIMRIPLVDDRSPISTFPETFQGPHLRHLALQALPFRLNLDYSQLLLASSHSALTWSTHPPTFIQILCSNGFHLCPNWRHSGLPFHPLFPMTRKEIGRASCRERVSPYV